MGDTVDVKLHTQTRGVDLTRRDSGDRLHREQSLHVTSQTIASAEVDVRPLPSHFEHRPVCSAQNRIRGSVSCTDLDDELLHHEDQVCLTARFEVVGIDHRRIEGGVDRVHSWRATLVLLTPFDDDDPDDLGVRRTDAPTAPPHAPGAEDRWATAVRPVSDSPSSAPSGSVGVDPLDLYRDLEPDGGSVRDGVLEPDGHLEPVGFVLPAVCPYRPNLWLVNRRTGQRVPAACYRLQCPVCLPRRAWRVAKAIALARPSHFLLLTNTGCSRAEVGQNLSAFYRAARVYEPGLQHCTHVEPSGEGQTHVHAWVHGVSGDDSWVQAVAERVGIGSKAGLQLREAPDGAPLSYCFKMVRNRITGGPVSPLMAAEYLQLNGGRLVNTSKGFFRDLNGKRLAGVRAAEVAASRPLGGEWITTTGTIVDLSGAPVGGARPSRVAA